MRVVIYGMRTDAALYTKHHRHRPIIYNRSMQNTDHNILIL